MSASIGLLLFHVGAGTKRQMPRAFRRGMAATLSGLWKIPAVDAQAHDQGTGSRRGGNEGMMTIQFWFGLALGAILATLVYVMAYIDLLRDVRREVERLREAQERIREGR